MASEAQEGSETTGDPVAVLEVAPSGRAKCRGCARLIAKGEVRLSERLANPFADDRPLVLLLHAACAACKRPEAMLAALRAWPAELPERAVWTALAEIGVVHRRLPRIDGAERAPSGRATCRACRTSIAQGAWRIRLAIFAETRFEPAGSIHAGCAAAYFGTADVLERTVIFAPELTAEERGDLARALG